jgi:competence protein ComEA
MWKQFIKDYFNFSKKERVAVLLLLAAIILVVLLPYIWLRKQNFIAAQQEEAINLKKQLAQLNTAPAGYNAHEPEHAYARYASNPILPAASKSEFYFDPNTLAANDWKRLGIPDKTVQTIQHYLAKGGRFRQPEDLGKIYGIRKNDYDRLVAYVQIEPVRDVPAATQQNATQNLFTKKTPVLVNINTADSSAWIALPGIGSKLAARIINFRQKLGGFYTVDQVAETFGLPDSVFQKIKSSLQNTPGSIQTININTADAHTLKSHPYIKWPLANAIVQYRHQHGLYKSVTDLLEIATLTPEQFYQVKPYLVIE